jgi:hypothetical protein
MGAVRGDVVVTMGGGFLWSGGGLAGEGWTLSWGKGFWGNWLWEKMLLLVAFFAFFILLGGGGVWWVWERDDVLGSKGG